MSRLEELRDLYDAYEKKAANVHKNAPRYAGIFGLGNDPRNHACHEMFYEDVGTWVQNFLKEKPSHQETAQAVRWILEAAVLCRNPDICGYFYAAQGHSVMLIPSLSQEESRELLKWYGQAYPEKDRMPVQQEIFGLLQKQAGEYAAQKHSGLWSLFRRKNDSK